MSKGKIEPFIFENPAEETEIPVSEESPGGEPLDELEEDFKRFSESRSTNNPEEKRTEPDEEDDIFESEISDGDNFKLQMFLSLAFALLDGLHVFLYGFISKYKITKEDIALEESDREGLEIYFRTQRVMDMINRLPVELIGFIHIEYMYFQKFQDFNNKMKELEEPTEDIEEEEEEEEEEKPIRAPKKKVKKKAVKKKASVKKAAKKPEGKPDEEKKE